MAPKHALGKSETTIL